VECRAPNCIPKASLIPLEYRARTAASDGGETVDAATYASTEPVWYTRTEIVSPSQAGNVALSARYATWRTIRWEVTEDFLTARATTDDSGAPLAPIDQPALFVFRIESHFDPERVLICSVSGVGLDCLDAGPIAPWPDEPAIQLDHSQSLTIDSPFVDPTGMAIASTSVPIYINNPADPGAPVAHCGAGVCGDLNNASQQLTDFSFILRRTAQSPTTGTDVEVTMRATFALSEH
jgi:hypothetical protein